MLIRCLFIKNDLHARSKCFSFRSRCCGMERNMLANALLPKSQEFLVSQAGLTPFWGRTKGTHLLNKFVYLLSFWFCRTELWQNPKETPAGGKITLFSALANSIFLPRLCKTDLLSFASSSSCHYSFLAFWLHTSRSVWFLQLQYIFYPKPFFLFLLALHLFF